MSRKSRQTLWKERLETISDCPDDLFDKIEPDEGTFLRIENAASGDVTAIRELASSLYEIYKSEDEPNSALLYYAKLGVSLSDKSCAEVMLKLITRFNEQFEYLGDTLAILEGQNNDEKIERLITLARVKRIIISATPEADYLLLTNELSELYDEYSAYARMYLASRRFADTGYYDRDKINSLAAALDVPSIVSLPVFTGENKDGEEPTPEAVEKECDALRFALLQIDMDEWRDFWLKAIYEYTRIYLCEDLMPFANDIIKAIDARCNYPRKKLHILSVIKYLSNRGESGYISECDRLVKECLFDGLEFDLSTAEAVHNLIKEAVYTSGKDEREKARLGAKLGSLIRHTKNRYFLCATMTNHMKRGNRHLWEVTVSIKTPSEKAPIMPPLRISERRNEVCRGGVTLDKEKKLSQVLCKGEIQIGEKMHPFEIDLILDISYVSSTKCELCEIKVKDHYREGEYLVMQCMLAIY